MLNYWISFFAKCYIILDKLTLPLGTTKVVMFVSDNHLLTGSQNFFTLDRGQTCPTILFLFMVNKP